MYELVSSPCAFLTLLGRLVVQVALGSGNLARVLLVQIMSRTDRVGFRSCYHRCESDTMSL